MSKTQCAYLLETAVNSISKDKIKAKIEELYKEHNKYKGNLGLQYSKAGLINSQIQVLQELLKEE